MVFRYVLMGFMALFYAFPAWAQEDVNCTKYKKFTTQPEIIFTDIPPQTIMDFSPAQLNEKRESYFYGWRKSGENAFWIADDMDVGAYFMSGIGMSADYTLQVTPHPQQAGMICAYVERLWVSIFFSATSFLDNAYAQGGCAGGVAPVQALMTQRYEAARAVVEKHRVALEAELPDIIRGLEDVPALDKTARDSQVKQALSQLAARYEEAMQEEIGIGNAQITKDDALAARYAACAQGASVTPVAAPVVAPQAEADAQAE